MLLAVRTCPVLSGNDDYFNLRSSRSFGSVVKLAIYDTCRKLFSSIASLADCGFPVIGLRLTDVAIVAVFGAVKNPFSPINE